MGITIAAVRTANPNWFSEANRKLFGDAWYDIVESKHGTAYLLRQTYGWIGMLGVPRKLHYRLHSIDQETLTVGRLVDGGVVRTMRSVEKWLARN